jgi:hypothetical protein
MDTGRNDLLGDLAADAALERSDFIVQATEQLRRFLAANSERISEIGGMTLIDDEPDYLSIAPDLTFRSRTRFLNDETGEWVSETEVIESPAELVELYNPADIYTAFADAAREAAGLSAEPTAAGELLDVAGVGRDEAVKIDGEDPYVAAADEWAATQSIGLDADDDETAAQRLYDMALEFQERSQRNEADLLDEFEGVVGRLTARLGDLVVVDDDDERLVLEASGSFRAEVVPEDAEGAWRTLSTPDDLVQFYDPTDVFGDLADALAEAYPDVAPEDGEVEDRETEDGDDAIGDDAIEDAEREDAASEDVADAEVDDAAVGDDEGRPTA